MTDHDEELLMAAAGVTLPQTGIQNDQADLTTHHIEGHARAAQERGVSSYFSVPLISQIDGTLWMGGVRQGHKLPTFFQYVVSLFQLEQYVLPPGCSRIDVTMYDSNTIPDETLLWALAELVVDLCQAGPTLVHCQAGLNRSGLISAMALRTKKDCTSSEAIAQLREKRCDLVLCNETFENWLLNLDD